MKKKSITIDGSSLDLTSIEAIALGAELHIPDHVKSRIKASQQKVAQAVVSAKPTYGINTGFGYFARVAIDLPDLDQLQQNLIKSHAAGYGSPLSVHEVRLAMALRLNVFTKGYTGVRFELCEALLNLIKADIYPIIPEVGSVGASGDLAPLAHLALPLIGEGSVFYQGKVTSAAAALKHAQLEPIKLAPKEGLSLINGTQIMLAVGGIALVFANRLMKNAQLIASLSYEGLVASMDSLDPLIHKARGHPGQIEVAATMRKHLKGSSLLSKKTERLLVQDPYSLRCAPQILGASLDALQYAIKVLTTELNAVTDNPLVFIEQDKILSGGNFHGQPLALAFDFAALAIAELGNVADRRIELFMNPHMSGLNAFLTPNPGICSGYMAVQYLSASLVNENKLLANPACTDSIPGNVGIEDHVSMGMTSARKLKKIVGNTTTILSIEALVAAQAIDIRKFKKLGQGTQKLYDALRKKIPPLKEDRIVAQDIDKAVEVIVDYPTD